MQWEPVGFPSLFDAQKSCRKNKVLVALRQAGVTEIHFRFSGGNDESFIDDFDPKENVDFTKILLTLPRDVGRKKETTLSAAVEARLDEWLADGDYNYRCGSGTWTMPDGKIQSEYQDEGLHEYNDESSW